MKSASISNISVHRHAELAGKIESELLRSLAKENIQTKNVSVLFAANSDNGDLIGGVTGWTSYGWLLVKTLWVSETLRGSGIGKQLMLAAEKEGKKLGCHSAWLDTSSSDARSFYMKLGYIDFGILENGPDRLPEFHNRWFMKKAL